MNKALQRVAKNYLPTQLARIIKRVGVYPRYLTQRRACHRGFNEYGEQYTHRVLFIAGLPKSGTTWLKKMLASYPGFHEVLIPEVTHYELRTGGSHDYDLPADFFSRFERMLVVTKMHVHGSEHNVALLSQAEVRHVVLYRDLRDVAVSYFFYVRQTPWHPEYPIYAGLPVDRALRTFAARTLLAYAQWVRTWHQNRHPELSQEVRYEELLTNTPSTLARVAKHFELDASPDRIQEIVTAHRFNRLSKGRQPGEENHDSFFRKGTSGDWKNYFTPELKTLYKQKIGDFLVEFGYETDDSW